MVAAEDDGEQPSRFLDELGVTVERIVGRPQRPLSMSGLVSELRRTVADPATTEPLREAAARRLARLAGESISELLLVRRANGELSVAKQSPAAAIEAAMLRALAGAGMPAPMVEAEHDGVLLLEHVGASKG